MRAINLMVFLLIIGFKGIVYGQELSDKELKASLIKEINEERKSEIAKSEQKIEQSVLMIQKLESEVYELKKNRDKIENLNKRINALEIKQRAIGEKELSVYSSNYQTAVINLAFLESDLKPLNLFQSSRTFFTSLNETSNPMGYPEYKEWYKDFSDYVDANKHKEVKLGVLKDMLTLTSDLTKETPLTGPIVGVLFEGINSFVSSIGSRKRALKAKSEKMMSLTMVLGQYSNDIKLIENEWEEINESLKELQQLYEEYINYNLGLIGASKSEYELNFVSETDGMKKLSYLNKLKDLAEVRVTREKENNPNKWKQTFHYEMEKIQAIKIRFGQITQRIQQNFVEYSDLIKRYEKSELVKEKMMGLNQKLMALKENFSESFNPESYINDAHVMYTIE